MNVSEQTIKPKNTRVAYSYARYPMDMYDAEGKARKVNSEGEEEAALAQGFTEHSPAIPQSVAVHAMTTQPAIQAGYDALKKELAEKTAEFNVKYAALQRKYDALEADQKELMENHRAANDRIAELVGPPTEAVPEGSENPFANMPVAESAPKSRAALLAETLGKKGKAKDA